MLDLQTFTNSIQVQINSFNTYLIVQTPICKYGQSFPNSVKKQEMVDKFLKFYYPIYVQDVESHLEALDLPY